MTTSITELVNMIEVMTSTTIDLNEEGQSIELNFDEGNVKANGTDLDISKEAIRNPINQPRLHEAITDIRIQNIVIIGTVVTVLSIIVTVIGWFCSFPDRIKHENKKRTKKYRKTTKYRNTDTGEEWEESEEWDESETWAEPTADSCD